ncbi:F-box/FBD/LRR-repeat protein At1g13570-like isoform X2 [Rutidosis leptorrhynchoides]|uniref:F-box/FBD/LRR-repeat protein At1g13570-like isoform X2 n=1 Tax=Rutidosis leptorrhynchoides TaxID=125765 RepID=UPI003A9A0C2F
MEWCIGAHEHPRELRTSLDHLKYMCLYHLILDGDHHYGMPILALLFRASPNLEKIKLRIFPPYIIEESDVGEDYSDIQLKNLTELEIEDFGNMEPELELVKFMLIKSPMLKTLRIFINGNVEEDEEPEMLNILLSYPRASPMVKISLHRFELGPYRCNW